MASAYTADPRELEAGLLLKAAARLKAVQDCWDRTKSDLDGALLYNRKAWLIFVAAAAAPENPLPLTIRQNVANLGLFVLKRTVEVMVDPNPEQLNSLIRINCDLAAGLVGRG